MKALITGGAGFIGSHLADLLLTEGYDVTVLDNLSSGSKSNLTSEKIRFVQGDVKDRNIVSKLTEDCDIIFDFAAFHPNIVGHIMTQASNEPAKDATETLSGIINVLEAARMSKSKVVLASTAAVYGEPKINPVNEDDRNVKPTSAYGMSKYCAELYCKFYHQQYNLPVFIGRIFNTYGPRMYKYLLFDTMLKLTSSSNEIKMFGTGEEIRDFIFVKDTAAAFYSLSQSDYFAKAVNIGTGAGTRVKDMIKNLTDILQIDPKIQYIGESWPGSATAVVADNHTLKNLGWKQQHTLTQGIELFVDWYNQNVKVQVV
jgi:UDP-glucose 4-epimerase